MNQGNRNPGPADTLSGQGNLLAGAEFLAQGFRLLGRRGIRPYVLVPLLINLLLFSGAMWWGYQQFGILNAYLLSVLPGWLDWLSWLIWPLFALVAVLIVFNGFSLLANFIAAPFNGFLAEKTEVLLTGSPLPVATTWLKLLLMVPRSLLRELRKLVYYLPLLLAVFLLSLIPGLNAIAPALWFLLGAWMMTVQYIDYPIDNHELGFASVLRGARSRRASTLGFGGAVMLATMVPLLNLIVMPAAVCGATALWVREVKPRLEAAQ